MYDDYDEDFEGLFRKIQHNARLMNPEFLKDEAPMGNLFYPRRTDKGTESRNQAMRATMEGMPSACSQFSVSNGMNTAR